MYYRTPAAVCPRGVVGISPPSLSVCLSADDCATATGDYVRRTRERKSQGKRAAADRFVRNDDHVAGCAAPTRGPTVDGGPATRVS